MKTTVEKKDEGLPSPEQNTLWDTDYFVNEIQEKCNLLLENKAIDLWIEIHSIKNDNINCIYIPKTVGWVSASISFDKNKGIFIFCIESSHWILRHKEVTFEKFDKSYRWMMVELIENDWLKWKENFDYLEIYPYNLDILEKAMC